jgi:hypoxanthine phosphoribosyltransferase
VMVPSLNLHDIDDLTNKIAERIRSLDFSPSCILYIDRAGKYIGLKLASLFCVKCFGISASREGSKVKNFVQPFLRFLPETIAHYLRKVELGSGFHSLRKSRNVKFIHSAPSKNDYIVVVDDAVDTGYSMLRVLEFLESLGYDRKNILTAVITVTGRHPVFLPDVYLYEYLITFPWSIGSRHYDEYIEFERQYSAL